MGTIFSALALFVKELVFLVSYVKNNAFPQPLDAKEEAMYLKQMAKGDEHARNKLIEHNLRLVAHIVKKFENTGEDPEDLISIGTIGLIKAIESYSTGKGTKLATYAARCIENEILITIACVNKRKKGSVLLLKIVLSSFSIPLSWFSIYFTKCLFRQIPIRFSVFILVRFSVHQTANFNDTSGVEYKYIRFIHYPFPSK
ncbi:sigma-70 family RNA polymerase sigma factor [Anoxybacillus flavithermus]|uniref:sigma-70 family RNA polymerase sigma factor n=1 Tax=Anoxybacillus flavithermus TaxID=33934 RepID=UPI001F509D74|nr:sigma-70 family RNA polymerase sigma factor [Anoxybacillus flavithermus]